MELWKRIYAVCTVIFVAGVIAPDPWSWFLVGSVAAVACVWLLKSIFWDSVQALWNQYQTERRELFDTIKRSDQSH